MPLKRGRLLDAGRWGDLRATGVPRGEGSLAAGAWDEVARFDLAPDTYGKAGSPAPLPHLGLVLDPPSGLTGSLDKSLAAATLVSAVNVEVSGTLAKTLDGVTRSSAGTVLVAGSLDKSLAAATLASSGGTGDVASVVQTLAAATVSSAGTVLVSGALAKTLADATLATVGGPSIEGATAKTLAAAILGASGQVDSGPASAGDPAPLPHIGLLLYQTTNKVGQVNQTLANATLSAAGFIPPDELPAFDFGDSIPAAAPYYPWARNVDWWQTDVQLRADTGGAVGAAAILLANAISASGGTVDVAGTVSKTLAAATSASVVTVAVAGTVSKTLAAATSSSAGTVSSTPVANLFATTANATSAGAGTVSVTGDLARSLAAATLVSTGSISGGTYIASVVRTLASATLSTTGGPVVVGTLSQPLSAATVSAAGSVLNGTVASVVKTLANATATASAEVLVYELGVRRRTKVRATERRIGSRTARATERAIEGELVE